MQAVKRLCEDIDSGFFPRDARAIHERIYRDQSVFPGSEWFIFAAVMHQVMGCKHLGHDASMHTLGIDTSEQGQSKSPSIVSAVVPPSPQPLNSSSSLGTGHQRVEKKRKIVPLVKYPDSDTEMEVEIRVEKDGDADDKTVTEAEETGIPYDASLSKRRVDALRKLVSYINRHPGYTRRELEEKADEIGLTHCARSIYSFLKFLTKTSRIIELKATNYPQRRLTFRYYPVKQAKPVVLVATAVSADERKTAFETTE